MTHSSDDWRHKAACNDLSPAIADAIFFPTQSVQEKLRTVDNPARPFCDACPVWNECLKEALDFNHFGTWGGMTEVERLWLKRNVSGIHKQTAKEIEVLLTEELPRCAKCDRHRKDYTDGLCYSCWTKERKLTQQRELAEKALKELAA